MKKSILEENLLTDRFFAWFRHVFHHNNQKRQFELRNFWSRLKMAPAHCDIFVFNHFENKIRQNDETRKIFKKEVHLYISEGIPLKISPTTRSASHSKFFLSNPSNWRRNSVLDICDTLFSKAEKIRKKSFIICFNTYKAHIIIL